jgi:hypothetical protein
MRICVPRVAPPQTVVSSEDWKKPNVGATVTVHLTGRLADGGVFEDQELTFVTDEGVHLSDSVRNCLRTGSAGDIGFWLCEGSGFVC